ncbi:MAG: hypothetical protein WCQ99_16415, partial [Pseudomonadota bacterium]
CSFEVQAHDKEEEKMKKSGGAIAADLAQDSLKNNLRKTLEIIDACFDLKEAYLKQLYPNETQKEIAGRIYQGILKRKEAQWKSQKDSLKP